MPVIEVGANLAQNSHDRAQSVITAVESVLQTANMVLELTPVDEVIVGGQIAEDLALLAEIMVTAELVWYDLQSLEAQITEPVWAGQRAGYAGKAWMSGSWKSSSSTTARCPMPCARRPW